MCNQLKIYRDKWFNLGNWKTNEGEKWQEQGQSNTHKISRKSISKIQNPWIKIEMQQNNDKSTIDYFGNTSEDFIKYLDTWFKPEINLEEDDNLQLASFIQHKICKLTNSFSVSNKLFIILLKIKLWNTILIWFYSCIISLIQFTNNKPYLAELQSEVKLSYRGQKNFTEKGINAERRDVLYKTFTRTIRRYLSSMFEKDFKLFHKIRKSDSELFKQKINEFYSKYFREWAKSQMNFNEKEQESLWFTLSVLITNKVSFPNKSDDMKKQLWLFRAMNKTFHSNSYINV